MYNADTTTVCQESINISRLFFAWIDKSCPYLSKNLNRFVVNTCSVYISGK